MTDLLQWLRGDLSSSGRIWSALGPVVILAAYFLLGIVAYAIRVALYGPYRDPEVESRGKTILIGMAPRAFFAWVMRPIWSTFQRYQIPPNSVTTLSVLLAAAAGISVAIGRFSLGGWLYLFAGACDFIDGRLARTMGIASPAGAVLDSVLDRYAECAVLVGLTWFYRDSWVLLAVVAALVGSMMVPYVRARGEGLGVDVKVGMMQRPERLVLLGIGLAFAPIIEAIWSPNDPHPFHGLVVIAVLIMATSTNITALSRLHHVFQLLSPTHSQDRSWKALGRGSLLRSSVAALVATIGDFLIVLLLVSRFDCSPALSTALGCLFGGCVNFAINRTWTFASQGAAMGQAARYIVISTSSALLNSGGVAILLFLPSIDYRIAWWVVRAAVFIGWNYPLQRDFVFSEQADAIEHPKWRAA